MVFERIKALCEANGMTIKGLEVELGFGNGTIRNWKSGTPTVQKIVAVANFFSVTVDSLVKGDT